MTDRGPLTPCLVIRPGLSFWIEEQSPAHCRARLQAFQEGCYEDTRWVDRTGGLFRARSARLARPPSLREKLVPTSWLPVVVELGPRRGVTPEEVADLLEGVLRGESEFSDHVRPSAEMLLGRFRRATSIAELLRLAADA
ncbi:MAG: hypothetical protein QNK05_06280 [Myxococcota bacterium]|nr:hypothetical protein [Myxococcota bacterium]